MEPINNKQFCAYIIFIGVLDSIVWMLMMTRTEDMNYSLLILVGVRGIFSILLYYFVRYKINDEKAVVLGVITSVLYHFFSVIGMIGMCFIFNTVTNPSSRKALLYHIDKEEGEAVAESDLLGELSSIDFEELREVAPLADGITDEDAIMRIAAINAIEETNSTYLLKTLIDYKKDTAKEVQYYAHEALKKIGDKYMKKINELTNIINKSVPDYKNFKELADLYALLAHKNIEHPIIVRFYRQEAIKYYTDMLKTYHQHRKKILQKLIPVLYENSDYRLCIKYCEEICKYPELYVKSIDYKARCLFKIRDISSLEQLAQSETNNKMVSIKNFKELTGSDV